MNIDEKLEKAAKRMEDYFRQPATADDYKRLLTSCIELGPEGLKKATSTWTDAQKTILKSFLEKAKAAPLNLDKEAAKEPRNQRDLVSVELDKPKSGHDTEDEELVKPEVVGVRHQGGSGEDGAWQGQQIKDPKEGFGRKDVLKAQDHEMDCKCEKCMHKADPMEGKREDVVIDKGGPGSGPHKGAFNAKPGRGEHEAPQMGVHKPAVIAGVRPHSEGSSYAGEAARAKHQWANQEHRRVLNEMKQMPSPKLGKHVEGVPDKKFDDCVRDVKAEDGKAKNAYAICTASLKKAEEEGRAKELEIEGEKHKDLMDHLPQEMDKAYLGFDKLSDKLKERGASDPHALAAWIGRKKYGKEGFQEMAHKGMDMKKGMENPQLAPEEMLKHLVKRMDERGIPKHEGVEMLHKMGYGHELLHKMWEKSMDEAKQNPDEKQDAQMAEKIEDIVSRHQEENKDAEEKEAEMKKDFELNQRAPGDQHSPADKQAMEQKEDMGVEDMDKEKGNPEQDQSKLPAKLGKGEPIPAQLQHEEVPDEDPEKLNEEERQSDLPEGKPSGRDGGRMKKSDEDMQKEAALIQPQHEKLKDDEDPEKLNKEEDQSQLPEGKPSGKDGGKMKKSVKWNMKNQLMNQPWTGRNASYKVDAYNEAQDKIKPKKGDFVGGAKTEPVKKSAGKPDWNEIIEKKQDLSDNEVRLKKSQIPAEKPGQFGGRSFSDLDLIKSLNLTPEQTKEFLKSEGFDGELVQSQDAKKKVN